MDERPGVPSWVVPVCYAVLAWAFWGAFIMDRGLHGDTIYVELSQIRKWWEGFVYPFDTTRKFISIDFHLAYLVSFGSYLSLHLLFGLYVWLTGLLTHRLVKSFLPQAELLAFAAGAITLTHGADDFANLVSVIMIRRAVVLTLLAMWLFNVGWHRRGWRQWILIVPIWLAHYLSLWTYEAGMAMLVFTPLLILSRRLDWKRYLSWSAAWMLVPAISLWQNFVKFVIQKQVVYQSAELADHFDLKQTLVRLGEFSAQGILFWRWPERWMGPQAGCVDINLRHFAWPLAIGTIVFAACAVGIARSDWRRGAKVPLVRTLLVGLGFTVLAYSAYLALAPDKAAPWWRTQFYASVPIGVVLASGCLLIDRIVRARRVLAVALSVPIIAAGVYAGLSGQQEQTMRWKPYQKVMAGIVAAAPRIKDGTFVALVGSTPGYFHTLCENLPPNPPFEDTMWMDSALRVLYPGTKVSGVFWWAGPDIKSPGSTQFTFDEHGAKAVKFISSPKNTTFSYDQMLAFAWDAGKGAVLLQTFPSDRIPGAVPTTAYNPASRILAGPPPIETVRKLAR